MCSGFILLCLGEMSSGDVPRILTPFRCESHFPSHPMTLLLITLESVFSVSPGPSYTMTPMYSESADFFSIFVKGVKEVIFETT